MSNKDIISKEAIVKGIEEGKSIDEILGLQSIEEVEKEIEERKKKHSTPSMFDIKEEAKEEKPKVGQFDIEPRDAVTTIAEMKEAANGQIIPIPSWDSRDVVYVKVKRPSLLAFALNGKIPNSLLSSAQQLFTGTGGVSEVDFEAMSDVIVLMVKSALVEPTWQELKDNDVELTDDQIASIFDYVQTGVPELGNFPEDKAHADTSSGE